MLLARSAAFGLVVVHAGTVMLLCL
jgi:hypothetical protein